MLRLLRKALRRERKLIGVRLLRVWRYVSALEDSMHSDPFFCTCSVQTSLHGLLEIILWSLHLG